MMTLNTKPFVMSCLLLVGSLLFATGVHARHVDDKTPKTILVKQIPSVTTVESCDSSDEEFKEVGFDIISQHLKSGVGLPENPFAHDEQLACGPRCVQFALNLNGIPFQYDKLIEQCVLGPNGTTLLNLKTVMEEHGLQTVALGNVNTANLKQLTSPAIVHLSRASETGHFLIVLGWDESSQTFRIYNPPNRYDNVPEEHFDNLLSGVALAFSDETLPAASEMVSYQPTTFFLIAISLFTLTGMISCFAWTKGSGDQHQTTEIFGRSKTAESTVVLLVTLSAGFGLTAMTGCSSVNLSAADNNPCHVDVGRFTAGPMLSYEFKIPNESENPFRILTIRKTCGCHSTEFDPETPVEPRDTATVKVNLPTAGNEGKTMYRFVMETDSANETLKHIPMTLTVDLVSKISAYPSIVTMGQLQSGSENTSTITITSNDIDPAAVFQNFELEQEFDAVTVVQKKDAPQGTLAFEVSVSESAPLGDISSFVILNFDDQQVPEIRVPVIGRIEGTLKATPNVLVRNTGATSRTVVRITSKDGKPFEISDIQTPEEIELEPEETANGEEHRFRVTIAKDIEPRNYSIVFTTNQPGQKLITLPVVIH